MKSFIVAAVLSLAATTAYAADVKQQIEAANRVFTEAYGKGDAAAVAALYTPDATVLPPGSEMVHGRPAIQAFWKKAMDSGLKLKSLEAVSVVSYGDIAREIGRASLEAGGPVEVKYVVVWQRVDGAWHLTTDIWNTNK